MTFSQIPYERADLAAWQEKYVRLTEQFKNAKTFDEADAIYYEACTCDDQEQTMVSLAKIRRDIDTRDAFYDAEVTYYNQEMPKLQPVFKAWTQATLATRRVYPSGCRR